MPGRFVFALVLVVIGLVALLVWRPSASTPAAVRHVRRTVPVAVAGLGVLLIVLSCFTIVGTRDIGIVTTFGRPVRHLDNGIHPKAPWQKVSQLDGAIQTDSYTGSDGCTDIRIGNESTACVDNSVRWRILPDAGDVLFRDYHTMDNIRDSLVTRELNSALNQVLADYNPLADINVDTADISGPDLPKFSREITAALQQQIGSQIEVLNVIIPIIRFDSSTQSKINAYQAEVANTRIAEQREKTAAAQSAANDALAASVAQNPNVLTSHCFDILEEMVKNSQPVPAAFSCWPGGSAAGAVVVPSGSPAGATGGRGSRGSGG